MHPCDGQTDGRADGQ